MRDVSSLLARLAPIPNADFSEFGPVEVNPLPKIQRLARFVKALGAAVADPAVFG
jgi:hypothetical protein